MIKEIRSLDNNSLIKKFIDKNIIKYKKISTEKLVDLSHKTEPWEKARKNLRHDIPSNEVIKFNDLKKFAKIWTI